MRKINAALFISLDGVYEAPGGEPTLPEDRRGWSMPFTDDEVGGVIGAAMNDSERRWPWRQTSSSMARRVGVAKSRSWRSASSGVE